MGYSQKESTDKTIFENTAAVDLVYNQDPSLKVIKRAITQSSKIRLNKGSINRIREARQKAEQMVGRDGNNAVFQYQFEMQNKEEESCLKDLYD